MNTKQRDEKCIPIAKEIIKLICENNGSIGDVKQKKAIKEYEDLEVKILNLYLENDLTSLEIDYIQQLALQAIDMPMNLVKASVISSYDRATEKVWGKAFEDVTFKDLDKILQ